MKAAWYEKQGPARGVLVVGKMPDPVPASGEVRIRISASGVNPGDIKKRQNAFGYGMTYPRVIPHSDGAGRVDQLGDGVSSEWTTTSSTHSPPLPNSTLFPWRSEECHRWISLVQRLGSGHDAVGSVRPGSAIIRWCQSGQTNR